MFKRTLVGISVAAVTALVLSGCSGSGDGGGAATTSIRIAVGDPAGSSVGLAATHFAEKVDELSKGKVKVEVFPDGTLFNGDQNAAVNLLGNGTLDATIISTSVYASFEPGMNVISLPYLFEDGDAYAEFLAGEAGDALLESLKAQNIEGLAMLTRTPRVTTLNDKAIEKPADFKGVKIRVPQNELWVKFFSALGAVPTPMNFSEVYTALQLGTIDAQENPLEVPVANKFFEVQDHLSLTNHIYDGYVLGFGQKKFDGYPADVQKVLQDAAIDTATWKRTEDDKAIEKQLADIKDRGVKVNELTPEATEEFAAIAHELYAGFTPLVGEKFMKYTEALTQ
ncbi:DctP family TRAP transporter solute-binding subunit [uncultured Microbacterium sp.]|uniref:DctP family TRAP transporter solute-binding subunit n=1 Tax=uncultured Microbacterium sp. TaxID=191216 RepID=UPI00262C3695|nr:DctP family TRAP transporter solute-binding subunit [uncultured Microbacterium sp.]